MSACATLAFSGRSLHRNEKTKTLPKGFETVVDQMRDLTDEELAKVRTFIEFTLSQRK